VHALYWPGVEKRRTIIYFLGASASPDPSNKSAWRPPNIGMVLEFQYKPNIWKASRPICWGGSGGADAPPGNNLEFVFSQPRASKLHCIVCTTPLCIYQLVVHGACCMECMACSGCTVFLSTPEQRPIGSPPSWDE
jgi:hypothetical protein